MVSKFEEIPIVVLSHSPCTFYLFILEVVKVALLPGAHPTVQTGPGRGCGLTHGSQDGFLRLPLQLISPQGSHWDYRDGKCPALSLCSYEL